jgi:hypothetical protein
MVRVSDDTASLREGTALVTGLVRSPFRSTADGPVEGDGGVALGETAAAEAVAVAEEAGTPPSAEPPGVELQ